jgi:hypothetical protein
MIIHCIHIGSEMVAIPHIAGTQYEHVGSKEIIAILVLKGKVLSLPTTA